jgi:hypothetical protein
VGSLLENSKRDRRREMKVIGIVDHEHYLMQVSHSEIEKHLNLYYDKLKKLKVGDEVDLGKGYDFERQIRESMSKTRGFIEANKEIIEAIMNGMQVISRTEGETK